MTKFYWLAPFVASCALLACVSTKTSAGPSPRTKAERTNADAPIPNRRMASRQKVSLDQISLGHAIYMRKCGECHIHKFPDEIISTDWHIYVPGMAWNAGIEPHEEKALLLYLQTAAREAENNTLPK